MIYKGLEPYDSIAYKLMCVMDLKNKMMVVGLGMTN